MNVDAAVEDAFEAFRHRIHAQCPDRLSIDLREPERAILRGICGEHGRVTPTRQGLCPRCAGYVETPQ